MNAVKDSCKNAYEASEKGPDDEAAYQECLAKVDTLYSLIPKPPEGSDPLGLKSMALLVGVGLAAYLAVKLMGKKGSAAPAPAAATPAA